MFRTHRVVRRLMVLSVLVFPGVADAQRVPDGWRWQLDKPAPNVTGRDAPPGAWQFQEMVPGMHVTAGPGVILYAPGAGAAGRFMVDADIVLFPNSSENGYGIMFGGRTGAGADTTLRTWNALVLNASGRFAVVRHSGGKVETVKGWTEHDAIVKRGAEPVTNRLRVWAERDSVLFVVNGTALGALPTAALDPDGLFGLRLDEGINTHVTNVDHTVRLLRRSNR